MKSTFQKRTGGDILIRCLMDVSIPENDKCGKCCINCDEKDICENKCCGIDEWETEEEILKNCIECEEW